MSQLSVTGRNPEALTIGCTEDSGAQSWCPTLVMGGKENKARAASGFRELLVHSIKELEVLLMGSEVTKLRVSQRLLREPQSHCGKSSPDGHRHQPQCQAAQPRK